MARRCVRERERCDATRLLWLPGEAPLLEEGHKEDEQLVADCGGASKAKAVSAAPRACPCCPAATAATCLLLAPLRRSLQRARTVVVADGKVVVERAARQPAHALLHPLHVLLAPVLPAGEQLGSCRWSRQGDAERAQARREPPTACSTTACPACSCHAVGHLTSAEHGEGIEARRVQAWDGEGLVRGGPTVARLRRAQHQKQRTGVVSATRQVAGLARALGGKVGQVDQQIASETQHALAEVPAAGRPRRTRSQVLRHSCSAAAAPARSPLLLLAPHTPLLLLRLGLGP